MEVLIRCGPYLMLQNEQNLDDQAAIKGTPPLETH